MKYTIAIDSFKGSLSSTEAADAISDGITKADKNAVIRICPMADGGEGTLEALTTKEERIRLLTKSATGKKKFGYLGISKDYAVVEMAQAVGLNSVRIEERNPELSTTYGVGILIKRAIELGIHNILIGIGGSGTNDGGAGMMECLGARFFDRTGKEIKDIRAKDLIDIRSLDFSLVNQKLNDVDITIASDVKNPLLGVNGATKVYGPQKGASKEMVSRLEKGMKHYADVLEKTFGVVKRDYPGAGAGGGIVYPLLFLNNVKVVSGAKAVIDYQRIDEYINDSDILITGEGSVDSQSKNGKTIDVLCNLAQNKKVPVVIFAGKCENKEETLSEYKCIRSIRTTSEVAINIEDSKKNAREYLSILAYSEFSKT
ncbi:MAG: glycerate kinase [Clostridiales bacterium]|nr:glycerate kinase [Clostridiales bacterium]